MVKSLLVGCGLLAVTAGLSFAGTEIGKPAPNFSLPDTIGKTHTLADLKGKYVVLEWYQPDCPFVRKHYRSGNMQALQKLLQIIPLIICRTQQGFSITAN